MGADVVLAVIEPAHEDQWTEFLEKHPGILNHQHPGKPARVITQDQV